MCRLLALAYPGPANPTSTIVGRDAFIDALDNQNLRVRILEREPRTIEALNIACRLEAYDRPTSSTCDDELYDGRNKARERHVRNVREHSEATKNDEVAQLSRQIEELRVRLERSEARNQQPASGVTNAPWPMSMPVEYRPTSGACSVPMTVPGYAPQLPVSTAVGANASHVDTNTRRPNADKSSSRCHACGQVGHWKRDCPNRRRSGPPLNGDNNARVGCSVENALFQWTLI